MRTPQPQARVRWRRALCALLVASGCDASPAPPPAPLTDAAFCAAARLPGLVALHSELATVCHGRDQAADSIEDLRCELIRVREDGSTERLADGVRAAWPLGGTRQLRWAADGSLAIHDGGAVTEIAAYADQPSLSPDGRTVAFVEPVDPEHGAALGVPTQIASVDLGNLTRTVRSDDEDASAPIWLSEGRDLLVLSTQFGMASVVRLRESGAAPARLTNLEHRTQDTVPPPSDQSVWHEGTLVYADSERLYALDLEAGTTTVLGPGSWPRLGTDGAVLAAAPERCPVRYFTGASP